MAILEVIALSPDDGVAAERGGADRLEIVREIATGGLTPTLAQFTAIRAAVQLPLRVMLRANAGFETSADEIAMLQREAAALRQAGAEAFVLGFLTASGTLDLAAIAALVEAIAPSPWTLHHAFDHARGATSAWQEARDLPRLDLVLSGGLGGDLVRGLPTLLARAHWQEQGPRWLAGGTLRPTDIAPLRAAGITQFHAGRAARQEWSWERPVDEAAVRQLRSLLDTK